MLSCLFLAGVVSPPTLFNDLVLPYESAGRWPQPRSGLGLAGPLPWHQMAKLLLTLDAKNRRGIATVVDFRNQDSGSLNQAFAKSRPRDLAVG